MDDVPNRTPMDAELRRKVLALIAWKLLGLLLCSTSAALVVWALAAAWRWAFA